MGSLLLPVVSSISPKSEKCHSFSHYEKGKLAIAMQNIVNDAFKYVFDQASSSLFTNLVGIIS